MFGATQKSSETKAMLAALNKSQAVIQFDARGIILDANQNFLDAMGYSLAEIKGQHHRMFVDPADARKPEYEQFWNKLRAGEYQSAEYRRIGKGGREIWIQASYNPVADASGKIYKVVKYATDITAARLRSADHMGQIEAIGKSQAVIEFNLDGTIINANENFLSTMGYTLPQIQGRHHSMFVEPAYAGSREYQSFWENLRDGQYQSAEYKRIGNDGREVWIQASYNPIYDNNGKPFKVVKYATDITAQKLENADYMGQIDAIGKSQAVIEFGMDGTIIDANQNFLNTLGYSLDEVKGRHHSMFVGSNFAATGEYRDFWAKLQAGEYQAGEYKRIGKGGREVWIQASYNPILDMNGKPFKVVKYATDSTGLMAARIEVGTLVGQTHSNIQGVAAATEEMSSSVAEISRSMALSKEAVQNIVRKTQTAGTSSQQLSNTAQSMEAIVNLIKDIAGQVNLLALNATNEAARAGPAGKGFAVVAAEVKKLAEETRSATDSIAAEISTIQTMSADLASNVAEIVSASDLVNDYVNSAAIAIEQQSMATQEISAKAQDTFGAVNEISDCVKRLAA